MNDSFVVVAGLGNPGLKYQNTRHNFGFDLVDRLARIHGVQFKTEKKFNADITKIHIGQRKVVLVKPLSYMNLSGPVVRKVSNFYQAKLEHVLVILDDANLPLGKIRFRMDGRDGGHHGLESISKAMGSTKHPRLRLGIGRGENLRQISGYVLDKFREPELDLKDKVELRAIEQIDCWLTQDPETAIQKFNGSVT